MPELELLRTLADFDGTQLARPVINVLKQVAMDRAEMRQVEIAAGDAPSAAQHHQRTFLFVEKDRIDDTEPVPQDNGARIDVRVAGVVHLPLVAGLRARM